MSGARRAIAAGWRSVPEIVPADWGEACSLEERLEVAVDYVLGV